MKNTLAKFIKTAYPELSEGLHLPIFAVVTEIPDPPTGGETCTYERPRYAVHCRLLTADMAFADIPELLDVPVALPAAGGARGAAGLPQPGTVVEIAFAYGRLTKPFVRSALPYHQELPPIDATAMRWQLSGGSYQQVDADGNWTRVAPDTITDIAAKLWIGSASENLLAILGEFMASAISALETLAAHTHPSVSTISQAADVAADAADITAQATRLANITK
jgi:hypothetical protein